MREKLIEILETVVSPKEVLCDGEVLVSTERVADHLIANGVTFAEDNNVPSKWIPVTEKVPDTAERVLVCKTWLGRVYKPVYGYYQDFPNQKGCWYILTEEGYYPQREVTHWMPLPEPPKGE
jgi:hypothetical protein